MVRGRAGIETSRLAFLSNLVAVPICKLFFTFDMFNFSFTSFCFVYFVVYVLAIPHSSSREGTCQIARVEAPRLSTPTPH